MADDDNLPCTKASKTIDWVIKIASTSAGWATPCQHSEISNCGDSDENSYAADGKPKMLLHMIFLPFKFL
jgi:hypothetical protein